jgi:LPXTG-motif cell wall-anchored protein
MTRALSQVVVAAALLGLTAAGSQAQQTTASSQTKAFTVLAVEGNTLVVRLPEGTREIAVPDDFRFTVNGQQMSVHDLRVGMNGTAVITTRTTVTPVTVTEVKNGTVALKSGTTVMVRTDEGVKSFSQGDIDKRGVKIYMGGKPVQIVDLHEGDKLSATIVTSRPPRIVTEKEVQAATNAPAAARAPESTRAAAAPAPAPPAAAPRPAPAPAPAPEPARTLPKTASSWPLLALASMLSIAMALTLTVRRRRAGR